MSRQKHTKPEALAPLVEPAPQAPSVLDARPDLAEAVRTYASRARSENTARARGADWRVFESWCSTNGAAALPASPENVAAFLADQARQKATATVVRYAQTIGAVHEEAGHAAPTRNAGVKQVLAGIKNVKGVRQEGRAALTMEMIERALPNPTTLQGIRDRAVLLFGLATALRRSNICAVDVEDLAWSDRGAVVAVRRSKTDQQGEGAQVALPYAPEGLPCPASAVRAWIAAANIDAGPLFRGLRRGGVVRAERLNDREVGRIVKRAARAVGLDEDVFGGHSLRAGYVTEAVEAGLDWPTIMAQTGHKLLETAKRYSRYTQNIFDETRVAEVFRGAGRGAHPTPKPSRK